MKNYAKVQSSAQVFDIVWLPAFSKLARKTESRTKDHIPWVEIFGLLVRWMGGRKGRPGYRTPSTYQARKDIQVKKANTKAGRVIRHQNLAKRQTGKG